MLLKMIQLQNTNKVDAIYAYDLNHVLFYWVYSYKQTSQLPSEANFCFTCFRGFLPKLYLGFVPLFPKSVGHTVSENI